MPGNAVSLTRDDQQPPATLLPNGGSIGEDTLRCFPLRPHAGQELVTMSDDQTLPEAHFPPARSVRQS